MGLRLRSIRQKIVLLVLVPVLSLIGLYVFALSLTAKNAINLSRTNTLKNATALAGRQLRQRAGGGTGPGAGYLSRPTGANLAALENARARPAPPRRP